MRLISAMSTALAKAISSLLGRSTQRRTVVGFDPYHIVRMRDPEERRRTAGRWDGCSDPTRIKWARELREAA